MTDRAPLPHEFMPQPGDRMWTPADWAWAGGLLDVLLPALSLGVPVVAKKFDKFDPQEAFALQSEYMKTQLAALQTQAKELGALLQKSMTPGSH